MFFIKNDLLRCRVFLLVLNWIGVLFVSRSFFLQRLREWNEWAGAPSCYLGMLNKLQKQVYRSINPASLQPVAQRQNKTSLSLFGSYYFGRCSSELTELTSLPYLRERSTRYSSRLHNFCVTSPRCYKVVYLNICFSRTVRPWNSLHEEYFPLNL